MNILLCTRHFPPAVSGGARRPYLWSKGFAELGHRVFVVAPSLPSDVHGLEVPHHHRDPDTAIPANPSVRDIVRDLILWPDPDVRWAMKAARAAKLHCPFTPNWIITSSPPESVHVAGLLLKSHWRSSRWGIDARDHWLVRPFRRQRENPIRKAVESRIACLLVSNADIVFTVNAHIADEFKRYSKRPVTEVPHFSCPPPSPYVFDGPGPHFVHTGSFAMSDPKVEISPLLRAFEACAQRRPDARLHLVGRLRDDEVHAVEDSPAKKQIQLYGVVQWKQSLAMQVGSDALIVCASADSPVPPSKIVEYRAAGRPIIGIGKGPWRKFVPPIAEDDVASLLSISPGSLERSPRPPSDVTDGVTTVIEAFNQISRATIDAKSSVLVRKWHERC